MKFELLQALRDLDRRTPAFFLAEMFSHGEVKLKLAALDALQNLDPRDESSPELRRMLKLIPKSDS